MTYNGLFEMKPQIDENYCFPLTFPPTAATGASIFNGLDAC